MAAQTWRWTCRECGVSQQTEVGAETRSVKCGRCGRPRSVPKEARGEAPKE